MLAACTLPGGTLLSKYSSEVFSQNRLALIQLNALWQQSSMGDGDERAAYKAWKLSVPMLYDWFANHHLAWPSLCCRYVGSPASQRFIEHSMSDDNSFYPVCGVSVRQKPVHRAI